MTNNEEVCIKINNLTVAYPASESMVLNDVSFEIKKGTISVLIGPNGSGKSTLLKAIMGLIPYQGSVEIEQKRGVIGYVPQRFSLDRSLPLSVNDFLVLPLKVLGYSKNSISKRLAFIGEHLHIDNLKNKLMSELSGGQFQRVLLGRALIHEPKILLLDEPEAGVDPGSEENFYDLLAHFKETHKTTILMASHELTMVDKYADQVICLNHSLVCVTNAKNSLSGEVLNELYGYHKKPHRHN